MGSMFSHSSSPPPPPVYNNPLGGTMQQKQRVATRNGRTFLEGYDTGPSDSQMQDWQNRWNQQQMGLMSGIPQSNQIVRPFGNQAPDPSMGIITNQNTNLAPSSYAQASGNQSPYFNANYR